MMQSFILMAVVTVLWAFFGYSLVFHEGNRFIGGFGYLFLHGVGAAPDPDYAATIPQQTFMVYQLMFAIITPALITGAFAERMKFKAMLLFMVLWSIIVYDPMAHMVWGKGGLLERLLGRGDSHPGFCRRHGGACDFRSFGAGVRVVSGETSGIPQGTHPAAQRGAERDRRCLLWVGWFGFNAGSALAAGSLATSAFVATHFGAAAAALGWSAAEWFQWQGQRPGRDLRRRRRSGGHHPRRWFRGADVRSGYRRASRAWSAT